MKLSKLLILSILLTISLSACSTDDSPKEEKPLFAKGADVSWTTEMEASGIKFRNLKGEQQECIRLLRDLGMNAIRLRVWVNPEEGWCNKEDVLIKAQRANNLGMKLMINFHYSDTWADPGKQTVPLSWFNQSLEQLCTSVANHTKEVLNTLKGNNIYPEWVQIGNETGNGMLWDAGKASENMAGYARLNNAAYNAVKSVFPNAKVIIHLQEGNKKELFRWLFDGLKLNGGKWDIIGLSLYPKADNWQQISADCIENMRDLTMRYQSEVMVCETGMPWDEAAICKQYLEQLIKECTETLDQKCLGIFYWEPQAHNNWKGYTLGAFDNQGRPTIALEAFR